MLDYLEKFKHLPKELQQVVRSEKAAEVIAELEEKYRVDLNAIVIRIMVKDIKWEQLPDILVSEQGLSVKNAKDLQTDMMDKLLSGARFYLGIQDASQSMGAIKTSSLNQAGKKAALNEAMSKPTPKQQDIERKEIETLNKKINSFGVQKEDYADLDERVAAVFPAIIQAAGVSDPSGAQGIRLKNIIRTCLKGIRNFVDTREALSKTEDAGGLGLDIQTADSIIKILKTHKPALNASSAQTTKKYSYSPFDKLEQIRDVEYKFASAASKKKNIVEANNKVKYHHFNVDELEHEIAPPPPAIITKHEPQSVKTDNISKHQQTDNHNNTQTVQTAPKSKHTEQVKSTVAVKRSGVPATDDKVQMNDIVKPHAKLQGPIEELAWLDLTKFRRLGENANVAVQKIENKIRLLEQEGFTKRQEGVNAWRHSPLNQIYVQLGHKSLTSGQSVENLLAANTGNNNSLTIDEFNAIVELNKHLRM